MNHSSEHYFAVGQRAALARSLGDEETFVYWHRQMKRNLFTEPRRDRAAAQAAYRRGFTHQGAAAEPDSV